MRVVWNSLEAWKRALLAWIMVKSWISIYGGFHSHGATLKWRLCKGKSYEKLMMARGTPHFRKPLYFCSDGVLPCDTSIFTAFDIAQSLAKKIGGWMNLPTVSNCKKTICQLRWSYLINHLKLATSQSELVLPILCSFNQNVCFFQRKKTQSWLKWLSPCVCHASSC